MANKFSWKGLAAAMAIGAVIGAGRSIAELIFAKRTTKEKESELEAAKKMDDLVNSVTDDLTKKAEAKFKEDLEEAKTKADKETEEFKKRLRRVREDVDKYFT